MRIAIFRDVARLGTATVLAAVRGINAACLSYRIEPVQFQLRGAECTPDWIRSNVGSGLLYEAAVFVEPHSTTDAVVLGATYDRPVLALELTDCINRAGGLQTGVSAVSGPSNTPITLVTDYHGDPADELADLVAYKHRACTKGAGAAGPDYEYMAIDSTYTVAWRKGSVIYNSFGENWVLTLGWYLWRLDTTVPRPLRYHLQVDSANRLTDGTYTATAAGVAAIGDALRAANGQMLLMYDAAAGPFDPDILAAIDDYTDVFGPTFGWLNHKYTNSEGEWSASALTDAASRIAAYEANKAEALTDDPAMTAERLQVHVAGAVGLARNAVSLAGMEALLLLGVRVTRSERRYADAFRAQKCWGNGPYKWTCNNPDSDAFGKTLHFAERVSTWSDCNSAAQVRYAQRWAEAQRDGYSGINYMHGMDMFDPTHPRERAILRGVLVVANAAGPNLTMGRFEHYVEFSQR